MKEIIKNILKFLVLYLIYLILTLIIFHIFGFYNFGDVPTKLVMARILGFPFILSIATIVFMKAINKLKQGE